VRCSPVFAQEPAQFNRRIAVHSPMDKKRVLFVEQNRDGTVGGSHTALLMLVQHIDRAQFDPVVAFYEPNALLDAFRQHARVVLLLAPLPWRIARADGATRVDLIAVMALLVRKVANLLRAFYAALSRTVQVVRIRPHVIHVNNHVSPGFEWVVAARICGAKLIAHQRGHVPPSWYSTQIDRVVCVSRTVQEALACWQPRLVPSVVHIYDAIDADFVRSQACLTAAAELRRQFGIGPDGVLFGVVGNIKTWKGQDVLIRALPLLPRSIPWKCLVIGSVSATSPSSVAYGRMLENLVRDLGLTDRVVFTGYRSDVPALVSALDILVHTSVLPEPFGLVILEGMALAKPVVCSAHGGPVEIVEDGVSGFLVPPGDPEALAARLTMLLASREIREQTGCAALQRVSLFNVSQHVDSVQNLYRSLWPMVSCTWAVSLGEFMARST
jgi:glycosyltransferase involved in cell wall biosynthesis